MQVSMAFLYRFEIIIIAQTFTRSIIKNGGLQNLSQERRRHLQLGLHGHIKKVRKENRPQNHET